MKRLFCLFLIFLLSLPAFGGGQANKLPRDMNALFARAQEFWKLVGSNQRLKALDYVLPSKRELMVSSMQLPINSPQVVGIDFTSDSNRALVKVSLKVFVKETAGFLNSTVIDQWVWSKDNWFLDLNDGALKTLFNQNAKADTAATDLARSELEKSFTVSEKVVELGTIPQGERRRFSIHAGYANSQPATLEVSFPTEEIANEGANSRLTVSTKEIPLGFVSDHWDGEFSIPVTLKASLNGASVERRVLIRGSVFAPLTITQDPSIFVDAPGNELKLRIRNNTEQSARILSISTDDAFDLAQTPEQIPPIAGRAEQTITLRRKDNGAKSDKVYITFAAPLNGRSIFTFPLRFRSER